MNKNKYFHLFIINPIPHKSLFLKFCKFEGKSEEVLFFKIWVCNLVLYVGLCLDLKNVLVIQRGLNFFDR